MFAAVLCVLGVSQRVCVAESALLGVWIDRNMGSLADEIGEPGAARSP